MAFPETPLGLRAEMLVDGSWVDFTKDVYSRDPITHQRGIRNSGAVADPASVPLTINNKDGKYSPRNPMSPYFGKIGRNTRVRLSLPSSTTYLELDGTPNTVSTPDAAALDITGDLDLRWEGEADWYAAGAQILIGKWGAAGNRSYHLRVHDGSLYLHATDNGTTGTAGRRQLPAMPRHAAVRGTIDVDNGAGGCTIRLYWAPTLAGPWTQVGADIVFAVTSIFASTAPLTIAPQQLDLVTPVRLPVAGRCHRAEVRNGINGTIVAAPDFTAQAAGTTSFVDSAGRSWTVTAPAQIRDREDRFVGEISSWPQRWQPSGADAWVPVQASGVLRRLQQGDKPLDSALRRRIPSFAPLAYWPMEEGGQATRAYSPIAKVPPLTLTNVQWANANTLASSGPLPTLNSSDGNLAQLHGTFPSPSFASLAGWHVQWIYRLDQPNTTLYTFMRIVSLGTVRDWYIQSRDNGSRVIGRDPSGNDVVNVLIDTSGDLFGRWVRVRFIVVQETSSTVRWTIIWTDVGGDSGQYSATFTGNAGRPTGVHSPPDGYAQALNGMAIGHISAWGTGDTGAYDRAIDAWIGEPAGSRMLRLCGEEGIPLAVTYPPASTEPVGVQDMSSALDLVKAAADADGGMLTEDQTSLRLLYRPRGSLYSQEPALVLNYEQGEIAGPLEPVDDDASLRNDITVQRSGGSSTRVVLEEGPLSVQAPPDGVGTYDETVTLSLGADEQTVPIAYWLLHRGTWDAPRYPSVTINLHRHPELIPAVKAIREGDVMRLTNLPPWAGFGDIDLMVMGLSEILKPRTWTITFNCEPAEPWRVGIVEDPVLGIVDTDGTELAAAVGATDTLLPARVTAGPDWVFEQPFDIELGGEVATVTAVRPAVADTFTRTVANGFGTADSGGQWALELGSAVAADFSVTGGYAKQVHPTKSPRRVAYIPATSADVDLYVDFTTSVAAAGGSLYAMLGCRYNTVNNQYFARIEVTTANVAILTLRKRLASVETQLATYTHPTAFAAGTYWRIRLQATGTTLRVKTWPVSAPEPATWQLTVTDTSLTAAGSLALWSVAAAANTNPSPEVRFDNFWTRGSQTFTVVRSVNGVAKGHAAGTAIQLAQPSVVAL